MGKLYVYQKAVGKQGFAKRRWQALGHAIRGIVFCCKQETHFKWELVLGAFAIVVGWWLGLSPIEWGMVVFCIILVLALEAVNTAIEQLCDAVSTAYHPHIKAAKDVAAGAVLLAAIGSGIVGFIIFLPKFFSLFF
jgi:diacylglycerol kinase